MNTPFSSLASLAPKRPFILPGEIVPKILIITCLFLTIIYARWWLDFSNASSWILFSLLFAGEVYHVWQAVGYLFTVRNQKPYQPKMLGSYAPRVDVFITACGEPLKVTEKTILAAKAMEYPDFQVFVLNDGFVAKKENWREVENLGKRLGVSVITRDIPGGAKAGNINNALKHTDAPFFALFDTDQAPYPEFLARTMGYFENEKMALVQTPQYYANHEENYLTEAAWEQQELFFGPICRGKNSDNATFWCGTNAVLRRSALEMVGGIPTDSITEDFLVSLLLHGKGYESVYVPEVLSEGMAPLDLGSFAKQQYRWARGCLDVIFHYNPFFRKGLTFAQKIHYLYSSSYYLNGLVALVDAVIPIVVITPNISPIRENPHD